MASRRGRLRDSGGVGGVLPEVVTGRGQTNKPILRGEKVGRKVYLTPSPPRGKMKARRKTKEPAQKERKARNSFHGPVSEPCRPRWFLWLIEHDKHTGGCVVQFIRQLLCLCSEGRHFCIIERLNSSSYP